MSYALHFIYSTTRNSLITPVNDTDQTMMQEIPSQNTMNEPQDECCSNSPVPDKMSELSRQASAMYDQFKESEQYERIMETREQVTDYIQRKPLESALYALGAGFLLGLLLKRK